jgi:hypothetical protein
VDPNSVLAKTQKGNREIETRENRLDHRLRALLIMVNGKSTAAELGKKFEQIGDISSMLQQLVAQGFVEAMAAPMDLRQVQVALCVELRNALGPDGDAITEKMEACRSIADLRTYLDGQRQMLSEWMGKAKSAAFWAKADPMLR